MCLMPLWIKYSPTNAHLSPSTFLQPEKITVVYKLISIILLMFPFYFDLYYCYDFYVYNIKKQHTHSSGPYYLSVRQFWLKFGIISYFYLLGADYDFPLSCMSKLVGQVLEESRTIWQDGDKASSWGSSRRASRVRKG